MISDSVWFKVVAGLAFILGIHYQNLVEIAEVKGAIRTEMAKQRIEMTDSADNKYVEKDLFKIILDDVKDIKQMVKELVQK